MSPVHSPCNRCLLHNLLLQGSFCPDLYVYTVPACSKVLLSELCIIRPNFLLLYGATGQIAPSRRHCWDFQVTYNRHTRTHARTTGRIPLKEGLARRRSGCLHNKHKRQKSMPSVGFEPAIPAASSHRPTPYTARPLGSASAALRVVI